MYISSFHNKAQCLQYAMINTRTEKQWEISCVCQNDAKIDPQRNLALNVH